MKKVLLFLLMAICLFGMTACHSGKQEDKGTPAKPASVKDAGLHKIGVIVYSNTDEEVQAIKDYLKGYIEEVFPDVSFVYSDAIGDEEQELAFIQNACDDGCEGFLSFLSLDLEKEVALCEKNKAYYILASGTVADESFSAVESNPYFIGEVGPGIQLEYLTGAAMAAHFVKQNYGNDYFILSGGGSLSNAMHLKRTEGILDQLQKSYGVSFEQSSEELASSESPVHVTAGDLSVCLVPGYISQKESLETARKEFEKAPSGIVLSVLPLEGMADVVKGSHLGVVDCYSTRNLQLFNSGQLCYVAGKYSSIVGPSFAAMYNAVTGYAEDFRENGKAFKATQGFWFSIDKNDYVDKYALANSHVKNAYNYEDLEHVCKAFNPDASLEDLKALISAYSYEDALARRGE